VHGANFIAGRIDRITICRDVAHIREHHILREVAALDQQRGRDPGPALRPTGDGRRMKQMLAQRAGNLVEVGHAGNFLQSKPLVCGHDELHRAFDVARI